MAIGSVIGFLFILGLFCVAAWAANRWVSPPWFKVLALVIIVGSTVLWALWFWGVTPVFHR